MEGFKGIFTAALTPFDNEGKINEKALERLIEMNIKKGVAGFYVGVCADRAKRRIWRTVSRTPTVRRICPPRADAAGVKPPQPTDSGRAAMTADTDHRCRR